MLLDRFQRTVLMNEYLILKHLDPEGEDWDGKIEILRRGWEGEYNSCLTAKDEEVLPEALHGEIFDILLMFTSLRQCGSKLTFRGFDANDRVEGPCLGYVRHLWETENYEAERVPRNFDGNSHTPMLEKYRSMVRVWKALQKYPLEPADVAKIEAAGGEWPPPY